MMLKCVLSAIPLVQKSQRRMEPHHLGRPCGSNHRKRHVYEQTKEASIIRIAELKSSRSRVVLYHPERRSRLCLVSLLWVTIGADAEMSAIVPHLDTIGVGRGCSLGGQKDTNGSITLPIGEPVNR